MSLSEELGTLHNRSITIRQNYQVFIAVLTSMFCKSDRISLSGIFRRAKVLTQLRVFNERLILSSFGWITWSNFAGHRILWRPKWHQNNLCLLCIYSFRNRNNPDQIVTLLRIEAVMVEPLPGDKLLIGWLSEQALCCFCKRMQLFRECWMRRWWISISCNHSPTEVAKTGKCRMTISSFFSAICFPWRFVFSSTRIVIF